MGWYQLGRVCSPDDADLPQVVLIDDCDDVVMHCDLQVLVINGLWSWRLGECSASLGAHAEARDTVFNPAFNPASPRVDACANMQDASEAAGEEVPCFPGRPTSPLCTPQVCSRRGERSSSTMGKLARHAGLQGGRQR